MWLFYGIIAIFVCSCISSAVGGGIEANQKKELPKHLREMLVQEFPAFATDFTYAKCSQCIAWLGGSENKNLFRTEYALFGDNKIKVRDRAHAAKVYAVSVAPVFSPALAEHARARPLEFFDGFDRAYEAAKTLAA